MTANWSPAFNNGIDLHIKWRGDAEAFWITSLRKGVSQKVLWDCLWITFHSRVQKLTAIVCDLYSGSFFLEGEFWIKVIRDVFAYRRAQASLTVSHHVHSAIYSFYKQRHHIKLWFIRKIFECNLNFERLPSMQKSLCCIFRHVWPARLRVQQPDSPVRIFPLYSYIKTQAPTFPSWLVFILLCPDNSFFDHEEWCRIRSTPISPQGVKGHLRYKWKHINIKPEWFCRWWMCYSSLYACQGDYKCFQHG